MSDQIPFTKNHEKKINDTHDSVIKIETILKNGMISKVEKLCCEVNDYIIAATREMTELRGDIEANKTAISQNRGFKVDLLELAKNKVFWTFITIFTLALTAPEYIPKVLAFLEKLLS